MTKNPNNTQLAMLIYRATPIPDTHKSSAELLNAMKYRTNLPFIDLAEHKVNEPAVERLVQNRELVPASGKELPKLDIGTKVLYKKNTDASKIICPKWSKGTIKNRENPRKYHILADESDRVVTRSRMSHKDLFH